MGQEMARKFEVKEMVGVTELQELTKFENLFATGWKIVGKKLLRHDRQMAVLQPMFVENFVGNQRKR